MKPVSLVLIVFLSCFIISCSPAKRLARLVKNNPELVTTDTVYKIDTTITQGLQDSAYFNFGGNDTLHFENSRMALKMAINYDTVYTIKGPVKIPSGMKLIATDKPDTTINKEATVVNAVNPVKVVKSGFLKSVKNLFILIVFMAVLYLVFLFVKSSLNANSRT